MYVLVVEKTNYRIEPNTKITDFRGDKAIIAGGRAPQTAASQGKIWVKDKPSSTSTEEYYPSVYDLKWIKIKE